MKKVIFDIDGVLLSEERYFDVSALTVWEILYSPSYMGLTAEQEDFDPVSVTEGQIASCRNIVWGHDELLSWLKARGINSNWDMVHADLITILWIMGETYQKRSDGERLDLVFHTPEDVKKAGKELMGLPIPKAEEVLRKWEETVPNGMQGEEVIHYLAKAIENTFAHGAPWAELRSDFWKIHTEAFQAWYLGDDCFISLMHHVPYSSGKPGFLMREVPLAPQSAIKSLFIRLKEMGYELGIATGRAREEMEIPFKMFHWYEEFDPKYMATASDAVESAAILGGSVLDKPNGFIFSCAIFGRDRNHYEAYSQERMKPSAQDRVYVCGDSYSDVIGSHRAGASCIGILTGLEGKDAIPMFEKEGVPYVEKVTDILKLIH